MLTETVLAMQVVIDLPRTSANCFSALFYHALRDDDWRSVGVRIDPLFSVYYSEKLRVSVWQESPCFLWNAVQGDFHPFHDFFHRVHCLSFRTSHHDEGVVGRWRYDRTDFIECFFVDRQSAWMFRAFSNCVCFEFVAVEVIFTGYSCNEHAFLEDIFPKIFVRLNL